MTAVSVHGVSDAYRVWDGVGAQLARKNVVAFALPGFDNPAPAGFTSTRTATFRRMIGVTSGAFRAILG